MGKIAFSPPDHPGLVINIGITGHRQLPGADLPLLRQQLSGIFDYVMAYCNTLVKHEGNIYQHKAPLVRLLSPLAEGSDRIAACCALEKGCELQCPLPFERQEYMKDFATEQSKAEFVELLAKASTVFEIASDSGSKDKDYQNVGEIILGHSDILIAVWTGEDNDKMGGTGDIVNKAAEQHIPVLWVHAEKRHAITLVQDGFRYNNWKQKLTEWLSGTIGIFSTQEAFPWPFGYEGKKKWNTAFFYTLFMNIIARRFFKRVQYSANRYCSAAQNGWNKLWKKEEGMPDVFKRFAERFFMPYNIWTESLSMYYADLFRSAGLFRHLFYFFATLGYGLGLYFGFWYEHSGDYDRGVLIVRGTGFALQALFLLSILWLRKQGDLRKWHQKFIDYRILAELLRQTLFLLPLGSGVHGINLPSYNKDANTNWINGYYRAILRQGGLPGMVLRRDELEKSRKMIIDIVDEQMAYHKANAKKNRTIHHKLDKFGDAVYWIGFIMIVLRVILIVVHAVNAGEDYHNLEKTLNILCLVCPALAAVAHAFNEQGGFERLEQRSEGMVGALVLAKKKMAMVRPGSYKQVKGFAEKIAGLMISEVTDWRIFIKSKEIKAH